MALYKQRGSKYWWYKFKWTVANADGNKETYEIRRSARSRSRREAEAVRDEHRRALRLGLIHPLDEWPQAPPPKAPSLREFARRFLDHAEQHTKPGTARFYAECLRRVLTFGPLADSTLTDTTGETIAKYVKWRRGQGKGNSLAAINAELGTLRRLSHLAEEGDVIVKAPKIHELPGQTGRERSISDEEETAYLRAASSTLRDTTILAVDTGLRPNSELFVLEWAHVRFERDGEAPHGFIHVADGKSKNAVRNVPLTPRARAVLEMRKVLCGESRYVFPGSGRSGHLTSVQHPHGKAIRKAGLKPFEIYCWRHTFGTRCAEAGMDQFQLARLMGHSAPSVAERYYVHITEPHVTAGFERFLTYRASRQIEAFPLASNSVQ